MCPLPPSVVFEARQHLSELGLSDDDLWTALTILPLALKDAAILFRAQRYEVGYEAAALLALKEVGRWKARAIFTVQDVMKAMAKPPQENTEAITRARQASELFEELQWAIGLTGPSDQARLCERLAVAFLGAPERMVWADKRASEPASFLGEVLVEFPDDGYFVVALIMRAYDGLRCALFFSCHGLGVEAV